MKFIFASLLLLTSTLVHAQDTITCTLSEAGNPKNSIAVTADLNNLNEDGLYSSDDGLDLKADNYSFDLSITKQANGTILINTFFYENNHVQDEVGSYSWEIHQKGLSVINEPLTEDNVTLMNFICDYK